MSDPVINGHFKVVYIKEKNEVEPVPHSWEENGVLYWPPKHSLVRQLQSKGNSLPDKNTWNTYNCSVKESNILLYMHASASADRYCNVTTSETSDEAPDDHQETDIRPCQHTFRKNTKKSSTGYNFNMMVHNSGDSSDESYSLEHFKKYREQEDYPVQQQNLKKPDAKVKKAVLEAVLTKYVEKVPEKPVQKKINNTQTQLRTQSNSEDEAFECDEAEDETLTETTNCKNTSPFSELGNKLDAIFLTINNWKKETKEIFTKLELRLDRLEELITQKIESHNITVVDEENLQILPISSTKDLLKFDKDLEDLSYKKKVFGHLHRVVGSTTPWKQACYKLTNTLFTKELLIHFSWTGLSRCNNKHAFNKLINVLDIFFKVIYKADCSFSYTQRDSFFRDGILKHSLTRLHGPKKNYSKTKGQNTATDGDTIDTKIDTISDNASNRSNYEALVNEVSEKVQEIPPPDVQVVKLLRTGENPYY